MGKGDCKIIDSKSRNTTPLCGDSYNGACVLCKPMKATMTNAGFYKFNCNSAKSNLDKTLACVGDYALF